MMTDELVASTHHEHSMIHVFRAALAGGRRKHSRRVISKLRNDLFRGGGGEEGEAMCARTETLAFIGEKLITDMPHTHETPPRSGRA